MELWCLRQVRLRQVGSFLIGKSGALDLGEGVLWKWYCHDYLIHQSDKQ